MCVDVVSTAALDANGWVKEWTHDLHVCACVVSRSVLHDGMSGRGGDAGGGALGGTVMWWPWWHHAGCDICVHVCLCVMRGRMSGQLNGWMGRGTPRCWPSKEWREERVCDKAWEQTTIDQIAKVGTGSTPLRSNPAF